MRVLQINTERTWRGGERQTLYTIEGLIEAGVEVGLVCRDGHPLHEAAKDLPVTIHTVRSTNHAFLVTSSVASNYDLLHAQSAKGQSIAVFTRPFHGKPVLYTRRVNFRPGGFASKFKYRHTTRIVAISAAIRNTMRSFGVKDVEVISSAVKQRELDEQRAETLIRSAGVPEDTKIIGWVGDLVPQKDPRLLLDTVRRLARERKDFVVLQCGRDQQGDAVRAGISTNKLEKHLLLLGHIDNVEDLYSRFDVFLVTGNETEGLNSSVYDAFIYNVPVVSTLTGGMRDSVGNRGFTCKHGDASCLADRISRLLDTPGLGNTLTPLAHKWVTEHVTIPVITDRYIAVYRDMLNLSAS